MKAKSNKTEVLNLKHVGKEKEKGRFKLSFTEKNHFVRIKEQDLPNIQIPFLYPSSFLIER